IPGEDGRLSLYLAEEHLAQAKGGTARAIFLSTVVRLPDGDVVHLIFIEEARGALEQADQYVHPGGEVGRIDQPGVRRTDNLPHGVELVVPPGGPDDDRFSRLRG